jgi:hypothetical protein
MFPNLGGTRFLRDGCFLYFWSGGKRVQSIARNYDDLVASRIITPVGSTPPATDVIRDPDAPSPAHPRE